MNKESSRAEFCSQVVEQQSEYARRLVKRRIPSDDSASDDIVQQVLLSLYQRCISYKMEHANALVRLLVSDELIEHWRKSDRDRRVFEDVAGFVIEESAVAHFKTDQDLVSEIQQLFSETDAYIMKQLMARHSVTEIAEQLGCHPGTVYRRIEFIRQRIESEGLFGKFSEGESNDE